MHFKGNRTGQVREFMPLHHLNRGTNIIPEINVPVNMGNFLSYLIMAGINEGAGFKGFPKIETLGGTEQLNAEDLFKIAGNLKDAR
jgi:hypothetical protein